MKIDSGQKARAWIDEIKRNYITEIQATITEQKIYRGGDFQPTNISSKIYLQAVDSVGAAKIFAKMGKKSCILNFASYKHPGGGFVNGSLAQEEALCYVSTLYPCIAHEEAFYAANNKDLNYGLYRNCAIYSPKVYFPPDDFFSDVITCPAPNNYKYSTVSEKDMYNALVERIKFMYGVVAQYDVDVLIVGAWGCGVFRQNPITVAKLLKQYKDYSGVQRVICAVPDENSRNYKAFASII